MVPIGKSFVETLQGSFEIALALFTPWLRSRRQRWGATDEEVDADYPGDELISNPKWAATHAITIDATPERIWPWIAQIGQGRGGFYAYEKLENLAGCRIDNTSRILEEHQRPKPGDPIRLHAEVPPLTVTLAEQGRALVLHGDPSGGNRVSSLCNSWVFLLIAQPDNTTRLLSRTRYQHADDLRSRLLGGPLLIEPVSFVMERKMLRVIKALAELPEGVA
jgi:hypothetical protein